MVNYTPYLASKAKEAESVDALMKAAEEENIALERDEAERIYNEFHTSGELTDDEINAVTGGGCSSAKEPSFSGTWATGYELSSSCPVCRSNCWAETGFIGSGPRNYCCNVCYTRKRWGLASAPSVVPVMQEAGNPNMKNRSKVWVQ